MLYLIKLLTTPLLIGLATLASRRWGPFVGGGIAGLPFISAPASIFIAIEQGLGFAAATAYSSLLGFGSVSVYCLVYAYTACKHSWPLSLSLALISFLATSFILTFLPHSITLAISIALIGPFLALVLMPNPAKISSIDHNQPQPHWKVPLQMVIGGLAVFTLTSISQALGSKWSGLLLTFPIITSVMTPFAHAFGAKAAILTLQGLLTGFYGTAFFCIIVATLSKDLGFIFGYAVAISCSLMVSFSMCWIFYKLSTRPLDRK